MQIKTQIWSRDERGFALLEGATRVAIGKTAFMNHRSLRAGGKTPRGRHSERGYSILQVLITVAIIGVVTGFAFIGIGRARANIAMKNSVRLLANNIEKARVDAVKRHS